MAETKTIAIKVNIEGNKELQQLQANFDKTKRDLRALNKAEKENRISVQQANAERAKLNVQLKANRNALTDQQNAILKNNNALKKNSGFVAGVKKGVGQWATSMIGVTVAIGAVTKLVGSAVNTIKNFEKANSQLRAVLTSTFTSVEDGTKKMGLLSTQAKELGATTAFTATNVAELQTEFAKLGFPTEQILNMTEATLSGAAALGSELGEQAALTGSVLKQFGLDSTEAARVNDVMAEAASRSALDFSKLSTALPIVGATAATAGKSLEETTALLGTLSNRGIDASTAATSLRNIFLELSKKGLTYNEAMEKINNATDKNKVAMDLFGKRAATAGIILAGTGDSVKELTGNLNNADGAAKAMADTMLDNLAGDITKAESAWEGFILSLEDGSGSISNGVREITQMGTAFLGLVTDINNGKSAFETFTNFFESTAEGMGIMNQEQASFQANLARNTELTDELQRQLEAGTITQEQYNRAVIALGNGWEQTKAKVEENPIEAEVTINGDEPTEEGVSQLSEKELKAIQDKAKARAKALKDIEDQERKDAQSEEEDIVDFDTELEMMQERNENILAVDQEFLDAKKLQEEEDALARLEREQKDADNIIRLEQLKRDAREQTLQATASILNTVSTLAKEGSEEQKALATAAALINTYTAIAGTLAAFSGVPIPGYAIAQSIAIGLSGFANVAKIQGVKFEDGGILKGASHAEGGIPFTVNGVGGFEAEGGEAIINKRSTAMFAPLLNEINQAGGGARLFQNGGLTPMSTGVTASQQQLTGGVDMDAFAERLIDGINDKEVVNVATDTAGVANEVQNVTQTATF